MPRSFFSSTIDARAASRASARWSAWPFQCAALSASTYGLLEQAELELRAQHARHGGVDHRVGDQAALERVEIRPMLRPYDDWKITSSPPRTRASPRSRVFASVWCSTVAPPVAAASEMTKPVEAPVALQRCRSAARDSASPASRPPSCRRSSPSARRRVDRGVERREVALLEQRARCDRSDSCRVRPRRRWRRSVSASSTTPARSNASTNATPITRRRATDLRRRSPRRAPSARRRRC